MKLITKQLMLAMSETHFKATGEGGYEFEGYGSKFNGVDTYGDTILPGAYKNVCADIRSTGRAPKMFFNHRSHDLPIGRWLSVVEDDEGLLLRGRLTKGMRLVEDIKLALAAETLDGLSVGIGLKEDDVEYIDAPKSGGPSCIIKNVSMLREVSLVNFPADTHGRVDMGSIKQELDSIMTMSDLEAFLREAGGFSKAVATSVVSRAKFVFRGEHGNPDAPKEEEQEWLKSVTSLRL